MKKLSLSLAVTTLLAIMGLSMYWFGAVDLSPPVTEERPMAVPKEVLVGAGPDIPAFEERDGRWLLNMAITPAPWPTEASALAARLERAGSVFIELRGAGAMRVELIRSKYPGVVSAVFRSKKDLRAAAEFVGYPIE
jgi:hypothetical protein